MSSSQQLLLGEGAGGGPANYIEDVFSTWLYTGTGSAQTITNGIDLSTKGGLVWTKCRNNPGSNRFNDTVRGATNALRSNSTDASTVIANGLTAFNANGYTLGDDSGNSGYNFSTSYTYVSWTFREQPKFFDVVTYTGTGFTEPNISHNLGSVPGCIIIKRTNAAGSWFVYHRSVGLAEMLILDSTAAVTGNNMIGGTPTSTTFKPAGDADISGATYVAYLFAHNAGGFGAAGTDNVISCGSYVGDGTTRLINIGYEPQWILIKNATSGAGGSANDWKMIDNMRGFTATDNSSVLEANTSDAEANDNPITIASQGFNTNNMRNTSETYIYIAIRRGLMKVPTSGTSVFQPVAYTGTNVDNRLVDTGIVTDAIIARQRADVVNTVISNRLQTDYMNFTNLPDDNKSYLDGLDTAPDGKGNSFSSMTGFYVGNSASTNLNQASTAQLAYAFRRAPSFMDVVMYTGTGGGGQTLNHNLGVTPELIISKRRSGVYDWTVYSSARGTSNTLFLNLTNAETAYTSVSAATSTTLTVQGVANASSETFVAYLFATCAGVSKVGSYTGTGTTLQINCGFTAGARFVLIKRTDSTGGWYYWDTARGIVAGNDPYLFLNSSNAEVTNTDYVDTYSAGFEISSTAPSAINASGGTFIFLAIA